MSPKKPRLPRIERTRPLHIEDETSHLWAVSYADFLMVLLSFFIIFFSIDDKKKNHVIEEIIMMTSSQMQKQDKGQEKAVLRNPAQVKANLDSPVTTAKGIIGKEVFGDLRVESNPKEHSLTVHMPDNIYPEGRIELSDKNTQRLRELIKQLAPYSDQLDFVFVGHTDNSPVIRSRSKSLHDNFDLSALRASSAVRSVMNLGVSKERMFLSGSADNSRNTRSLSIQIIDRSKM